MYKDVLRSMEGVELFPVIAILIFIAFFIVLLVYVIRLDKREVRQMAAIPLEDSPAPSSLLKSVSSNGKAN
jgi:hypothetical protein